MKKCIKCGAEIEDSASFCSVCGTKQPNQQNTSKGTAQTANTTEQSVQAPGTPLEIDSDQYALLIVCWCLGWIGFLIIALAGNKNDHFIHFWTNQLLVLDIFSLICFIAPLWLITGLFVLEVIWSLVILALWIVGLINICQKKMIGLPLLGSIRIIS